MSDKRDPLRQAAARHLIMELRALTETPADAAAVPPALAIRVLAERDQILASGAADPATLVHLAEIADILEDDATALLYWEAAALAGSEDAVEVLEIMRAERR